MQVTDEMVEEACNAFMETNDLLGAQMRAALTAALAKAWRPIESGPRDGTTILLYAPGWDSPKTGWTFGDDDFWQDCPFHHKGDPSYTPTHWMPLPAPPPQQEGE